MTACFVLCDLAWFEQVMGLAALAAQSPGASGEPVSRLRRLGWADWLAIAVLGGFVALNFYLWSLPISQTQLFLISLPLGAVGFTAFLRYAMREREAKR